MDPDKAAQIIRDVAVGRPPKESKVKYDDEALKYRSTVEAEWEDFKKKHPEATLDVPVSIDGM